MSVHGIFIYVMYDSIDYGAGTTANAVPLVSFD